MSDKVKVVAAAKVNAFLSPSPGIEFQANAEFESATRSSAGVYTLTLEHHTSPNALLQVTPNNTAEFTIVATQIDKKTIQVNAFNNDGFAADTAFYITVSKIDD